MSRNLSLLLVAVTLLAPAWATFDSLDDANAKDRPVAKVVKLLGDMLKELGKEASEDEAVYNKMSCWCKTGNKEKTKSIADAKAKIEKLSTQIQELTASSAKLGNEIDKIKKELGENKKSLDQVTAMRDKETKAFKKEEAEMMASILSLRAAVAVLKKPTGDSFLQQPGSRAVRAMLQRTLDEHADMLNGVLEPSAFEAVESFIQQPDNSYKAKSGEIKGVLEEMLETFKKNLKASQAEETKAAKSFGELQTAKKAQIAATQKQVDDKTKAKADADKKNAEAKTDLVDTKKTLTADTMFLKKLVKQCKVTDKQYEERLKTRLAETEAVSKALAILNSDDARDVFTKSLSEGFLQRENSVHSQRQVQASDFLAKLARRFHSSQLSALAYSVKLDAFTEVKKSIDQLVSQLLKDQKDEKKQKDFCDNALKKNKLKTKKKDRQKKDLSARMGALKASINSLEKDIKTLKAEVTKMLLNVKKAGENREEENRVFQKDVVEQRETQKLLKAALRILDKFYKKKAAAFIQGMPKGFKAYKNNDKSGGVMAMIKKIIGDAKESEAECIKGELTAAKEYKEFVEDTNKAIKAKSESITNKAVAKGSAEQELAEKKSDKEEVEGDLGELADLKAELHGKCDFLLKNFKVRQASRNDEIQALKQAKAILSGAKFKAFLQHA